MEKGLLAICGIIVGSIGLALTVRHGFSLQTNSLILLGSAALIVLNKK
jgi:hypothetical protein